MDDVAIDELLAGLGLEGGAAERARAVLVEAGLTNARKQRISVAKVGRAKAAVNARLARLCAACAARTDAGPREVVVVAPGACARCGGSDNARALAELADAFRTAGLRRLVVVGGSPSFRAELAGLGRSIELRLVDGTARRTKPEAKRDVEWADVVAVAGATELAHRVSSLYTDGPQAKGKLVVTARRGLSPIAGEIVRHIERRSARR